MVIRVILCAILGFCVCFTSTVGAADWANWRGPDYNGISSESNWEAKGLEVVWHFALGTGCSSMAVSDGKVYSMGNVDDTDIVYCIDAASGKEIWRHSYPEPLKPKHYKGGPSATPTVTGGKVFTISKSGKVFCLDAKTGKEVWGKTLAVELPTFGLAGSCVVIDDMVILNAGTKGMALSIKDGKVIWENGKGKSGYASAVPYIANGQKAVALFTFEHVVGLVAATGKELWSFPWKTKHDINAADPVISGDLVFIASGYGHGCALLKVGGGRVEKLWENKNMRSQMSGAVLLDGFLYGIDGKQLSCLDLKTGQVKWSDESIGNGSLIAAGGKLIVLSESGELKIADASPDAFEPIATKEILSPKCWTPPVLSNGRIFARDPSGDLVCVESKVKGKSEAKSRSESSAPAREGRSSGRNRRDRSSWYGDLSEEEQAWMKNRRENRTEEEKAERSRGRKSWQDASEQEKEQMRADWRKRREALLKEMREALSKGGEWPQWHGAGRDNISTDTGLLKKWPDGGPKMLWSYDQLSDGYGSVAIAGGKIYATGSHDKKDYLTCLDMDGNFKWKKPCGRSWAKSFPGSRTTPTVDDGLVYVISGMLDIACLDAESGQEKWAVKAGDKFKSKYGRWGSAESPLIVDDKVICTPSGDETCMVAFDKKTGEVVWTTKGLGQSNEYCSPIYIERGGKKIIVTILKESILGVNAANGDILWQYACSDYQRKGKRGANTSTPTYHDGAVYFTSGYDRGDARFDISADGMSITQRWNDSSLDNHHGGVVLVDGYLYGSNWVSNSKGNWLCVDWETGKVMYDAEWFTKGPMTYADGMLYCFDEKDGNFALVKADPSAFEVVSSFKVTMGEGKFWSHPVVAGGRLYVRHGGVLMVHDIKAN